MFLKNNDIDDDNVIERNSSRYTMPLVIIMGAIVLCVIIFMIFKLFKSEEEITYDTTLYTITLNGDSVVSLYLGDEYLESGYRAMDDNGNDVTTDVAVTSNIDTSNIGNYKVSYTIGNVTKERIVKVIEKPIGATYIHLYGDVNTYLYVGETYQEKGYEVIDTVDSGNLNGQVKIKSNVDTSKEGIYKVTYSVTNSSNITTSQTRTVIVMDRSLSLLPSTTDITNKNITINIYAKDELFKYLLLPNNIKVTDRMSTYEVNSNGTYKFIMYNTKGESTEKELTINNIDKANPVGSCKGYYQNNVSYISINASDDSGISKYVIGNTTYTGNEIRINSTITKANITIYDKAGNSTIISCTLENKNSAQSSSSSSKPSSSQSKPSSSKPSSSSSSALPITDPLNPNFVDTSHYCKNNKIRTQSGTKIYASEIGCSIYYGNYSTKMQYISINSNVATNFKGILTNVCTYVEATDYIKALQCDGTFNGKTPGQGNLHGYGLAIDLFDHYTYTYKGKTYSPYSGQGYYTWSRYTDFICNVCDGKEDCPYNINYIIFKRYFEGNGWCWGGNWSPAYFDPMHFELRDNNSCLTSKKQQVKC